MTDWNLYLIRLRQVADALDVHIEELWPDDPATEARRFFILLSPRVAQLLDWLVPPE